MKTTNLIKLIINLRESISDSAPPFPDPKTTPLPQIKEHIETPPTRETLALVEAFEIVKEGLTDEDVLRITVVALVGVGDGKDVATMYRQDGTHNRRVQRENLFNAIDFANPRNLKRGLATCKEIGFDVDNDWPDEE